MLLIFVVIGVFCLAALGITYIHIDKGRKIIIFQGFLVFFIILSVFFSFLFLVTYEESREIISVIEIESVEYILSGRIILTLKTNSTILAGESLIISSYKESNGIIMGILAYTELFNETKIILVLYWQKLIFTDWRISEITFLVR